MTNGEASSAHEGPVSIDDGEIEVTPEMVEAGVEFFMRHDPEPFLDRLAEVIAGTYRVMREVSLKTS